MSNGFPTLIKKYRIRGIIEALTGLHIGGSDVGLKVGGADKVVVKDPKTGRPYIPGSSFKGKVRSLLERAGICCDGAGLNRDNHRAPGNRGGVASCRCGKCVVCQLFGVAAEEAKGDEGFRCSGRLIVRDAHLTEKCAKDMENWRYLAAPYIEEKTEVSIDRLTSQANPRNFERVPAGAEFAFEFILDVHEGDDVQRYFEVLKEGLRLLANDYLGGQGTRGYGAVRIRVETIEEFDIRSAPEEGFRPCEVQGWDLPWEEPPRRTEGENAKAYSAQA